MPSLGSSSKRIRCALLCSLLLATITLGAMVVRASEPPPAPNTPIADVRVEGRKVINMEKLPRLSTRPGMPFDPRVVEEDVRTLFSTKKFVDVRSQFQQTQQGLIVIFQVVERPILNEVVYVGSTYNDKALTKKTGLEKNSPADPYAVASARGTLEDFLKEKGYPYAKVKTLEGDKPTSDKAVFLITEGVKQRIYSTSFVGNTFMSGGRLQTYVQAKPGILWLIGGEFNEKKLNDSVDALTAMYRGFGFFQAKVGRQIHYGESREWVDVTFIINEGIRYKVRNISFIGNEIFKTEELTKDLKMKQDEFFDQTTMNTDLANMRDLYGGHGYVMADVQADPRFLEEPGQLDLVFNIKEGDRYRVGNINIQITGDNPHTKRQVVLERLRSHPGDIVDTRNLRADERTLKMSQVFSPDMSRGAPPPKVTFVTPKDDEEKVADKNDRPSVSRGKNTSGGARYQSPDVDEVEVVVPVTYQALRRRQQRTVPRPLPADERDAQGRPINRGQQLTDESAHGGASHDTDWRDPTLGLVGAEVDLDRVEQHMSMRPLWQPARPQGDELALPDEPELQWRDVSPATTVVVPMPQTNVPARSDFEQPVMKQEWQSQPREEQWRTSTPNQPSNTSNVTIRGQSPDAAGSVSMGATSPSDSMRWGAPSQPVYNPQVMMAQYTTPVPQYGVPAQQPPVQYAAAPSATVQQPYVAAPQPYAVVQQPYIAAQQTAPVVTPGIGGGYTNPYQGPAAAPQPVELNPASSYFNTPAGNGYRTTNFQSPVEGGAFGPPPVVAGPGISGANPGAAPIVMPTQIPSSAIPSVVEQDKVVDLDVAVAETQTGRIMFGAGVNSDAGLVGNILLEENNFDWRRWPTSWEDFRDGTAFRGAGEQFRMEAQPGTQVQRYLVSWSDPYLAGTPVAINTSGYFFTRNYTSWLEQRVGGTVGLGYQLAPDLQVSGGFRGEDVEISNPVTPAPPSLTAVVGHNTLLTFQVGLKHDTRDSPYLATEGHLLSAQFEQAIGDFDFPQEVIEARQYFLLNERPDRSGRHVLALGAKFGFSGSDTPIFENFFAGGFSTMRGFGFRGASPKELNVFVGGQFQMLYTAEYLFPLTADDTIRAVAFCDFGTTEQTITVNWDNFRVSPGLGLRVSVPALGPAPLAFDFAVPVHHAPGDDLELFSFWVGFQR